MNDTLRASDRDREEIAAVLREHYAQGRLTIEEFDQRSTAALAAKTMGDLGPLLADLPEEGEPRADAPAWSTARTRWIAVAGAAAAVALLVVAVLAGRAVFAVPGWLVVLVLLRLMRGRSGGAPRAVRGSRGPTRTRTRNRR
jgi:hypothetical protein